MQRAAQLDDAASCLVDYIEANGRGSASGVCMLSELGWTRRHATQVLRQLEQGRAGRDEQRAHRFGAPEGLQMR